jgi:N-terminal domain of toast_rack, DUF2154
VKTINSPEDASGRTSASNFKNPRVIKVIQTLSRVVLAIFLLALIWAIYQALSGGNPLPVWAWFGILTLLAVAVGLGVAYVVYRGVAQDAGPFDMRLSSDVSGRLLQETRRVEAGGAASLRAEINMAAGDLLLEGGATGAMDAGFTYDDADWKLPEVTYTVDDAGQGNLIVRQRTTHRPAMRQGRCEWVIRLNEDLLAELKVKFGAGRASLRPVGLMLARLRVDSGVGELILDLSGSWQHNMEAFVKTGIGDTTIILPHSAGIRIQTTVGLGSIDVQNLTWDGEAYTNALYGHAPVYLDITLQGGIGKLKLLDQAQGIGEDAV